MKLETFYRLDSTIIIGIFIIFLVLMMVAASKMKNGKFGGIIMIGPLPIIFGLDAKLTQMLIILTTILAIAMGFIYLLIVKTS